MQMVQMVQVSFSDPLVPRFSGLRAVTVQVELTKLLQISPASAGPAKICSRRACVITSGDTTQIGESRHVGAHETLANTPRNLLHGSAEQQPSPNTFGRSFPLTYTRSTVATSNTSLCIACRP